MRYAMLKSHLVDFLFKKTNKRVIGHDRVTPRSETLHDLQYQYEEVTPECSNAWMKS